LFTIIVLVLVVLAIELNVEAVTVSNEIEPGHSVQTDVYYSVTPIDVRQLINTNYISSEAEWFCADEWIVYGIERARFAVQDEFTEDWQVFDDVPFPSTSGQAILWQHVTVIDPPVTGGDGYAVMKCDYPWE